MANDDLGIRMKGHYEHRARQFLPRRTNTIIRADGKAFHTYTRGRERPWDPRLHESMVAAALAICAEAHGALCAYTQSDEISVLLTDYGSIHTEAWFDSNVQKITSVAASVITAAFNVADHPISGRTGHFDARAFSIPDPIEVHNYFVWRQKDAERNSIAMLAQTHFNAKQLDCKSRAQQLDMLGSIGEDWTSMPASFRLGTLIVRSETGWTAVAAPAFTEAPDTILNLLPGDHSL